MTVSKAWDWNAEKDDIWLNPSEESYYISAKWKKDGYRSLLDFGCGLGRHSVYFSQQGFSVSSFDLSPEAVEHLRDWAKREYIDIDVQISDMLHLPYTDNSFDCLFAYHVISHTDTPGFLKIMNEIKRVIKPEGEIFITLCSKETYSFTEAGFPKIDENTILKTDDGPEINIPHFYVDLDTVVSVFDSLGMGLLRVRHIDDCYWDGEKRNSKHYFVLARNTGD